MELRAEGLSKSYKKRRVVDGVGLSVNQGEIVGLLGPNGAGKTTTFYMIVGMVRPESGRILLDDEDITSIPMYRRARMGIGYLAQESSVSGLSESPACLSRIPPPSPATPTSE